MFFFNKISFSSSTKISFLHKLFFFLLFLHFLLKLLFTNKFFFLRSFFFLTYQVWRWWWYTLDGWKRFYFEKQFIIVNYSMHAFSWRSFNLHSLIVSTRYLYSTFLLLIYTIYYICMYTHIHFEDVLWKVTF